MGGRGQSMELRQSESGLSGGNAPQYSQTIDAALGQKGTPMSMKQANIGANPNFHKGPRYQNNCQRCVFAYLMRRKGYDVEARGATRNDALANGSSKTGNFFHIMHNPKGGTFRNLVRYTTGGSHITDIQNQMKKWGDGAIAIISFGRPNGAGHVFCVEQNKGQTIFIDPQVHGMPNASSRNYLGGAAPGTIRLMRVDDLEPTDLIAKAVKPTGT